MPDSREQTVSTFTVMVEVMEVRRVRKATGLLTSGEDREKTEHVKLILRADSVEEAVAKAVRHLSILGVEGGTVSTGILAPDVELKPGDVNPDTGRIVR